ncbi:MAG: bifunctional oligoribonuclease/PAP phosphatase NrnA, partial [Oscillospiraceae bacterium]|nr:bifunctional oligoribonuclease/PAP phosphatase NrnA [Oscillospiraceae bacterium]
KVRVACADDIPLLYGYLTDKYEETYEGDDAFSYKLVVTVDAASPEQLGRLMDLCDSVALSIDHHASNTGYASKTLLDEDSASCAEIVYYLLLELSVKIDGYIAAALYTGVSTDTGCFRFRNTTMDSHRVAAELIGCGIDLAFLNRVLFETRSRGLISLQCQVMGSLEYYGDGKIAAVTITKEMMSSSGAKEEDMSSISPIPRSIEGVEVGITFRELENGLVKCSVRTTKLIDASKICMLFGGGGHHGAAGFMCTGEMDDIKTAVIRAVIVELGETKA